MASRIPRPPLQRDTSEPLPIPVEYGGTEILEYTTTVKHESDEGRECSEYIRSWAGVTRGFDALETDKIMNSLICLQFEVVSARTNITQNQKYVAYTVMVTLAGHTDSYPAIVERRYSEFLHLYVTLRRQYPIQLQAVRFPRKAIIGNFWPETITDRSKGFEHFLELICCSPALRNSPQVTNFFQRQELIHAMKLIEQHDFSHAATLVENCFRLMNKLHTDRSPAVMRNLCLLVCLEAKQDHNPRALDLACLAVRRFQSVSDADLLRYYVPLLNLSLDLSIKYGKGTSMLQDHLAQLRQRGMALHDSTPLLDLLSEEIATDIGGAGCIRN
ncbi:Hypothetical protein domain [Nesidiocoris tenuis]|uniref:PX domain-containing protein n=1 Tax=Nesidiocoris tenuis TaxID=355587 RepID=A0ABN7A9X0_9HEMI|nr:Hypothetical protein domain [Nesidiocoris tenuis]